MTCVHHFLIPPADGPTSIGRCKRCGAGREFQNSLDGWVTSLEKAITTPIYAISLAEARKAYRASGMPLLAREP